MNELADYRRTKYCPKLKNVLKKKKEVENQIKIEHPRANDMHTYISDNSEKYKMKFLQAYNWKCAYCGASIDLLPKNIFEIDHFIYEKSKQFHTKKDAGYIENLVLSCHDCNHNKSSFLIEGRYLNLLNPDGDDIKQVFVRDEKYYICITDTLRDDPIIKKFHEKLQLGSELHRLDYLLMNIIGMQRKHKDNNLLYSELGKIIDTIRVKRNIM